MLSIYTLPRLEPYTIDSLAWGFTCLFMSKNSFPSPSLADFEWQDHHDLTWICASKFRIVCEFYESCVRVVITYGLVLYLWVIDSSVLSLAVFTLVRTVRQHCDSTSLFYSIVVVQIIGRVPYKIPKSSIEHFFTRSAHLGAWYRFRRGLASFVTYHHRSRTTHPKTPLSKSRHCWTIVVVW